MRITLIAAASVLALAGPAVVAQTSASDKDATTQPGATTGAAAPPPASASAAQAGTMEPARASRLIGMNIENAEGDDIGEIKDMVLDPKSGQVQKVVVGVGGFLGVGEKNVALEWDKLQIRQEVSRAATPPPPGGTSAPAGGAPASRDTTPGTTGSPPAAATARTTTRVVVDMTKEQLKAAPEFKFDEGRAAAGSTAPARTPPAGGRS